MVIWPAQYQNLFAPGLRFLSCPTSFFCATDAPSGTTATSLLDGRTSISPPTVNQRPASPGTCWRAEPDLDLRVLHTSVLTRAIRTANLALDEVGRSWLKVRRSWRLNERHYGDLTGKDKKQTADEFGLDQVKVWRRSFDVAPPVMPLDDPRDVRHDPRYRDVPEDLIPRSECLKDVVTSGDAVLT